MLCPAPWWQIGCLWDLVCLLSPYQHPFAAAGLGMWAGIKVNPVS